MVRSELFRECFGDNPSLIVSTRSRGVDHQPMQRLLGLRALGIAEFVANQQHKLPDRLWAAGHEGLANLCRLLVILGGQSFEQCCHIGWRFTVFAHVSRLAC